MKHRAVAGTLASVVALAAITGCDRAQIAPRRDAGTRGARIPGRPSGPDESGPDRIYVLRDPVLNQQPERWRMLGWDLDGRCTEPPRHDGGDGDAGGMDAGVDAGLPEGGPSWEGWDIECTPRHPDRAGPILDGDECRDNAFGAYVSLALATLPEDPQAEAAMRMERGEFAVLLRIRGYGGGADDPQVEVDVWPTVYGAPRGGMRGERLRWDGTDAFWIAEEGVSATDPDQAVIRDAQAYVAGGLLVMRLPTRAEFDFASREVLLRVRVTDGTLTGRIAPDPSEPLRSVLLSGRWPLQDIFEQLPWLGLCAGDPRDEVVIALLRQGLESGADVRAEPGDPDAPLVPCEAISMAVEFTGYPGELGGRARFERPSGVCPGTL